ncbi:MAG: hypothetical protein E6325_27215 [Enterobacteriaceae bacterium]|nr:hypothetical protein [Enterobacteriaceae bacterium]
MTINSEQIQALKEKAECICGILENIAGYEPGDIDGDDVELRFETEDGFDTGCNVSIVEQCQKSADVIRSLLAERDADKALIAEQAKSIAKLERALDLARNSNSVLAIRSELEARTLNVKLPEPPGPMSLGARAVYIGIVSDVVGAFQESCAAAGITLVVGE